MLNFFGAARLNQIIMSVVSKEKHYVSNGHNPKDKP